MKGDYRLEVQDVLNPGLIRWVTVQEKVVELEGEAPNAGDRILELPVKLIQILLLCTRCRRGSVWGLDCSMRLLRPDNPTCESY